MILIKTFVIEMKNTLDGFISRLDITKKRISELENLPMEYFHV